MIGCGSLLIAEHYRASYLLLNQNIQLNDVLSRYKKSSRTCSQFYPLCALKKTTLAGNGNSVPFFVYLSNKTLTKLFSRLYYVFYIMCFSIIYIHDIYAQLFYSFMFIRITQGTLKMHQWDMSKQEAWEKYQIYVAV